MSRQAREERTMSDSASESVSPCSFALDPLSPFPLPRSSFFVPASPLSPAWPCRPSFPDSSGASSPPAGVLSKDDLSRMLSVEVLLLAAFERKPSGPLRFFSSSCPLDAAGPPGRGCEGSTPSPLLAAPSAVAAPSSRRASPLETPVWRETVVRRLI